MAGKTLDDCYSSVGVREAVRVAEEAEPESAAAEPPCDYYVSDLQRGA
jgi:hypothetical protein